MNCKETLHRFTGTLVALAASVSAAQAAQQGEWTDVRISAAADDSELNGSSFKPVQYRFRSSFHVENGKRLVLVSTLEALEYGGDYTWLKMPMKRTVLYTAPHGKGIVDFETDMPAWMYERIQRPVLPGSAHLGLLDWTRSNDNEFVTFWGDQWGSDRTALSYFAQVGYRVKLVDIQMSSPINGNRYRRSPGRGWRGGPRRR